MDCPRQGAGPSPISSSQRYVPLTWPVYGNHRKGCTETPEPVYGIDRNGCTGNDLSTSSEDHDWSGCAIRWQWAHRRVRSASFVFVDLSNVRFEAPRASSADRMVVLESVRNVTDA